MTAVLRFAAFCKACKDGLHTRCWDHLGELTAPCPCGCWDDEGMLTQAALLDMMRRQPVVLARHVRFTEAFARTNTFDLHLRLARGRR
jgi:hypothetical protein